MSGLSIQKKINKAYKKAGNKLGFQYEVYRGLNNVNVLDARNWISTISFSVSLNEQFSDTIKEQIPIWTVYSDYDQLQEGDFVTNNERTFLIITKKELLPILALELPDRIDIKQVSYSDTGNGFEPNNATYMARNVPAFISYGSTNMSGNTLGLERASIAGVKTMTVYTHLPVNVNLMNETALDYKEFSGTITGYDYPFIGAGIKLQVHESGVV